MFEILFPLSITLAFETAIYLLLKWRDLKLFIVASVLNLVLNPIMNFILLMITDEHAYLVTLIICEIFTVIMEASIIFAFMRLPFWKVLLFAVAANGMSFLVGFLLQPVYQTRVTIIVLTVAFFLMYIFLGIITILYHFKNKNKEKITK